MIEMLFILGFSLHNIEEGIWLPEWSRHAMKFHVKVSESAFRFTVVIITALGYLITFQYFIFPASDFARYIHSGFVMMMLVNVIFPHLLATIVLRRYAPGTATGMLLITPIGAYILAERIRTVDELIVSLLACLLVSAVVVPVIRVLLKIGDRVFG